LPRIYGIGPTTESLLSLSLCFSPFLFISLFCFSLLLFLSLFVSLSFCFSLFLFLSLFVSLSFCFSLFLFFSLYVSLSLFFSLFVSLFVSRSIRLPDSTVFAKPHYSDQESQLFSATYLIGCHLFKDALTLRSLGSAMYHHLHKQTNRYVFLIYHPIYTSAGFDLTTHSSGLLGGRRKRYLYIVHAAKATDLLCFTMTTNVYFRKIFEGAYKTLIRVLTSPPGAKFGPRL
jgi:hypothetical protein